jgi:hypothetical protein
MFVPRKEAHPVARFDDAFEHLRLPEAWDAAQEIELVSLPRALKLTMLLGKEGHRRFQPAARRFLERFIREDAPRVDQLVQVIQALDAINGHLQMPAWDGLLDLADQLEQRRRTPTKEVPLEWRSIPG